MYSYLGVGKGLPVNYGLGIKENSHELHILCLGPLWALQSYFILSTLFCLKLTWLVGLFKFTANKTKNTKTENPRDFTYFFQDIKVEEQD